MMQQVQLGGTRLCAWPEGRVAVERGGEAWVQSEAFVPWIALPNGEPLFFSQARAEMSPLKTGVGAGFCWLWSGFANGLRLETRVWVAHTGEVRFELIPLRDAPVEAVHWPAPFVWEEKTSQSCTVLPMMQGCLVPGNWPEEIKAVQPPYFFERSGYMPWIGQVRRGAAWLAIVEQAWDAGYELLHPPGGPTRLHLVWRECMGRVGYPRRFSLRLLAGGYVELCKAYRQTVRAQGGAVPLAQKLARQPKLARLIGCPVIHTWSRFAVKPESALYDPQNPQQNDRLVTFAQRQAQLQRLKARGVQKAYVHLDGWGAAGYDQRHPDVLPVNGRAGGAGGLRALAAACRAQGYLFALHDQYRDYYLDAASYSEANAVLDRHGARPAGCTWNGGRQTFLCASLARDYVERNYRRLDALGIPLDGAYLDVFSVVELDECLDPRHPMTRRECSAYRCGCFDFIAQRYGIASSEEPLASTVDHLALCHHAPYPTAPRLNGGAQRGVPVPLFNLVYHDCIFIPWDLGEGAASVMPNGRSGFLYALLNGGMGYLPIEPTARELEKAAAVAALHEKVALSEMTLHEFIAGDPERQRTLFANGISVEVDFRHNTWRIEQTNDVEVR